MDKLKTYLSALPASERDGFSSRCGTTFAFLRNVMYGQRVAGEKLCVAIERESGHVIRRQDLRPHDFWEIWPDLAHLAPPAKEPA